MELGVNEAYELDIDNQDILNEESEIFVVPSKKHEEAFIVIDSSEN